MEEQKNKLTDQQLAKEMRKGKRDGAGGKLLIGLGAIVVLIGMLYMLFKPYKEADKLVTK